MTDERFSYYEPERYVTFSMARIVAQGKRTNNRFRTRAKDVLKIYKLKCKKRVAKPALYQHKTEYGYDLRANKPAYLHQGFCPHCKVYISDLRDPEYCQRCKQILIWRD